MNLVLIFSVDFCSCVVERAVVVVRSEWMIGFVNNFNVGGKSVLTC